MKVLTNRPNKPKTTPSGAGFKTKGSPGSKENTSLSSKYLGLLKRKDETMKEASGNDKEFCKTISNAETRELKDMGKVFHDSRKTNNKTNNDKLIAFKKEMLILAPKQSAPKENVCGFRTEPDYNCSFEGSTLFKAFRSPPVNNKLTLQNSLLNSYNSTGKTKTKSTLSKGSTPTLLSLVERKSECAQDNSVRQSIKDPRPLSKAFGLEASYIFVSEDVKVPNRCTNHPDKKSKYYVRDEELLSNDGGVEVLPAFCSNCTFNLVKHGYSCEEIVSKDENFKKAKLSAFLEKLKKQKENCEDVVRILDGKSEACAEILDAEMAKIDAYFDAVIEDLNAQRASISKRLITTYNNSNATLSDFKAAFNDYLGEFKTITQDIDQSYTQIIKNTEIEPFNDILNNYKERIDEFKETNWQLERIKIFSENISFNMPVEVLQSRLNIRYELCKEQSKIIDSKVIDLSTANPDIPVHVMNIIVPDSISDFPIEDDPCYRSNLTDEFFKRSALSNGDVNVSFDKDYKPDPCILNSLIGISRLSIKGQDSDRSTGRLSTALDRINNSQTQMNNQYMRLLGLVKKTSWSLHEDNHIEEPVAEIEEQEEIDQNIFEFEGHDAGDMLSKQTPDLSGKTNQSEYLKDYFLALSSNMGDNDIRTNIEQNIVNRNEVRELFKSQKVLFQ